MSLLNNRIVIIIINYFFLYSMLSTLKLDDVLTTFEKGGKKDLAEDRKTTNFPTTCFHKFPSSIPLYPLPPPDPPTHSLISSSKRSSSRHHSSPLVLMSPSLSISPHFRSVLSLLTKFSSSKILQYISIHPLYNIDITFTSYFHVSHPITEPFEGF